MTETNQPAPRGARCEAHGLLYDPNQAGGCVLCRREAGQPVRASAPQAKPREVSAGSLRQALAVTAGLILVTSLGLYGAHKAVVQMISGYAPGAAFDMGMSPEELERAGVDPRVQEVLDAVEELDEIDARRYGDDLDDGEYRDGE